MIVEDDDDGERKSLEVRPSQSDGHIRCVNRNKYRVSDAKPVRRRIPKLAENAEPALRERILKKSALRSESPFRALLVPRVRN